MTRHRVTLALRTIMAIALSIELSAINVAAFSNSEKSATDTDISAREVALTTSIATLRRRLTALESGATDRLQFTPRGPTIVRAPFEVVDDDGNAILHVSASSRAFVLLLATGETMVQSAALSSGGFVKVFSADRTRGAAMGTFGNTATVRISDSSSARGIFQMGDDGKAVLQIVNAHGSTIASFTESAAGAGQLQLNDVAGVPTVEAGTLPTGVGVVRAGPVSECEVNEGLRAYSCIRGHH